MRRLSCGHQYVRVTMERGGRPPNLIRRPTLTSGRAVSERWLVGIPRAVPPSTCGRRGRTVQGVIPKLSSPQHCVEQAHDGQALKERGPDSRVQKGDARAAGARQQHSD
jgi:hypothetical protein